jgi:hypothetical protein
MGNCTTHTRCTYTRSPTGSLIEDKPSSRSTITHDRLMRAFASLPLFDDSFKVKDLDLNLSASATYMVIRFLRNRGLLVRRWGGTYHVTATPLVSQAIKAYDQLPTHPEFPPPIRQGSQGMSDEIAEQLARTLAALSHVQTSQARVNHTIAAELERMQTDMNAVNTALQTVIDVCQSFDTRITALEAKFTTLSN